MQQALDLVMEGEGDGLSLPGVEEQVGDSVVWFVGRVGAHVRAHSARCMKVETTSNTQINTKKNN